MRSSTTYDRYLSRPPLCSQQLRLLRMHGIQRLADLALSYAPQAKSHRRKLCKPSSRCRFSSLSHFWRERDRR